MESNNNNNAEVSKDCKEEKQKSDENVENERKDVRRGRGRLYIPHGRGKEKVYKPHAEHINVAYTQCGPDWSSRLRRLPSPKPKSGKPRETTFHPPMKTIRHFPHQHNISSKKEYKFYPPHGIPLVFGKGKTTKFDDVHKASLMSRTEITDSLRFGNHGYVLDPRNGISESSPGDKPYQAVEYSINFHKLGSTRPVVDFGGIKQQSTVATVSIKELPTVCVKPYVVKEAERNFLCEVNVVKDLEHWRAASPLTVPVTDTKA